LATGVSSVDRSPGPLLAELAAEQFLDVEPMERDAIPFAG
jgi:hypothetical protein